MTFKEAVIAIGDIACNLADRKISQEYADAESAKAKAVIAQECISTPGYLYVVVESDGARAASFFHSASNPDGYVSYSAEPGSGQPELGT